MRKRLSFAAFFRKDGIYFTKKHSGKMSGMWSLSTNCARNPHCIKQQGQPGTVCAHCYVNNIAKRYPAASARWAGNTEALNNEIIPVGDWPHISKEVFRLEAFGDLQSTLQAIHYINFSASNPQTMFALWTKHPEYINNALAAGYNKPENMIIIFSSFYVNKPARAPYEFIDKVFTVYGPEYARENNININCGARNCNTCRRCYRKADGIEYVNELLK